MRISSVFLDRDIIIGCSLAHWKRNGTQHGAKSSPTLLALSLVRLGRDRTIGRRLWLYVRGGYACFAEYYTVNKGVGV